MKTRRFGVYLLLLLLAVSSQTGVQAREKIKPAIDGLTSRLGDEAVHVSFHVENGLTDEVLERIHSGIPVVFRHKIEVLAPRRFLLSTVPVVARAVVDTRTEYDSLTQNYTLVRSVRLKSQKKKQAPAPDETRRLTESFDEMRDWMTRVEELAVYDPSRPLPEEPLRVRVDSNLGRRLVLWMFPAGINATAEQEVQP